MSQNAIDWTALLVMAIFSFLYSRWQRVTEPFRLQREAKARKMAQLHRHYESATAETLRCLLSEEVWNLREAKKRFLTMVVFTALFHITVFFLAFNIPPQEGVWVFMMLLAAWISTYLLFARHETKRISGKCVYETVAKLHKLQTRHSIGVLIDAMETGDEATANLARSTVIAILPELTSADAGLLGVRHRACLHQALCGTNSEFIVAILQAFEHVGDPGAIPYVKRLIPCPVWLWEAEMIEQAARKCLASLEVRQAEQQSTRALLHVVEENRDTANILLRPIQTPRTPNPQELLRGNMASSLLTENNAETKQRLR